jgi:hypothetical protein
MKQRERDRELERPRDFILYLTLHKGRKAAINGYLATFLRGKGRGPRHSPVDPGRVRHVRGEHCPTAVELEIEVARVGVRLHEELDTAILPDGCLEICMDASHISVPDEEQPVEAALVV